MKNIVPLDLNKDAPYLQVTAKNCYAHLLRGVDRKQYLKFIGNLNMYALASGHSLDGIPCTNFNIYLTGAVVENALLEPAKQTKYDDIDIVGVGPQDTIFLLVRELVNSSRDQGKPGAENSVKTIFDYGSVKYNIEELGIMNYLNLKCPNRFKLTAKPPVHRLAPIDLGLITDIALKERVSQCTKDTLESL